MIPPSYLDPLGSRLPALERNILRLRAMQMLLVLFYAEQLKQRVVDLVETSRRWRDRQLRSSNKKKETKVRYREALDALVADGAITSDDKAEICKLVDYRNIVAHDIHVLVADLSVDKYVRQTLEISGHRFRKYDYVAADRLRYFLDRTSELNRTHAYVYLLRADAGFFETAERAFLAEIKSLTRKVDKLWAKRQSEVETLNAELTLSPEELVDGHPRDPGFQYDNGRLTKRGEELCYRMFDIGKSDMAVAHLTGLSLGAARKRKKNWLSLGGSDRPKVDLQSLPRYRRRRRYDED